MKKIGVIVVLLIIGLCACNDSLDYDNKTESTSETINDMNTTVTCSSVSYPVAAETDEMADLLDYKISQFSSDYSFDAVVNVCLDKVGIDDYTLGEEYEGNSEYHPIYYPDYSIVLDELCEGNDSEIVLYQPEEYEYHISRELVIDIWIYVVDFDDDQWAEIGFRRWADEYVFSECDIVVDHCGEGYFFVRDDNWFTAYYYFGNFYLEYSYFFNNGNAEQYQIYLDICEELGLPTCDEVTQEIIGGVDQ